MSESFNPFSLEGKTILVTGASSGIGRATAVVCSKMGATMIITGRNRDRLDQTLGQLSGKGHVAIAADLAAEDGTDRLLEAIDGKINGVVHCAGISGHMLFQYIKEAEVRRMFDINFNAPLLLSRDLVRQKKIEKGGSIVFITSTAGILSSYMGGSIYSSTKGALNGLIKGMAMELASKKIRVNSVMPSMISTPIIDGGQVSDEQIEEDKKRYPMKRYGYPEEVAYAVVYLLSDASAWTTGTNLLMDGGRSLV